MGYPTCVNNGRWPVYFTFGPDVKSCKGLKNCPWTYSSQENTCKLLFKGITGKYIEFDTRDCATGKDPNMLRLHQISTISTAGPKWRLTFDNSGYMPIADIQTLSSGVRNNLTAWCMNSHEGFDEWHC